VLLQVNGSMGTGWPCASMPLAGAELKARGVRGLSLALPGCGCVHLLVGNSAAPGG
jgi:hypothetical protein